MNNFDEDQKKNHALRDRFKSLFAFLHGQKSDINFSYYPVIWRQIFNSREICALAHFGNLTNAFGFEPILTTTMERTS